MMNGDGMKNRIHLNSFCINIINIILGVIIYFFFVFSMSSTAYEQSIFQDNIFLNVFFLVIFLFVISAIEKLLLNSVIRKKLTKHNSTNFFIKVFFACGLLFVVVCQIQSTASDPGRCVSIANQILEYNYSSLAPGGYLDRYPHQMGIILLYALLATVFGKNNYLLIHLLNLVMMTWAIYCLSEFADKYLFKEEKGINLSGLWYLLFIPIYPLITYVYGLPLGFSLAVISIYYVDKFLSGTNRRSAVFATILMGLAIALKENCVIFLLAVVIICIFQFADRYITEKKFVYRYIICVFFLMLSFGLGKNMPGIIIENMTGIELRDGIPKTSWMVMGLQGGEGEEVPGLFNGYTTGLYEECDFDNSKAEEIAREDLKKIIRAYMKEPISFVKVQVKKANHLWNNPTFNAHIFITNNSDVNDRSEVVKLFHDAAFMKLFSTYSNYFQLIVWSGMLLWIVRNRNENLWSFVYPITFIGGFLFHTFWEIHADVSIPYFLCLLPYAAKGWSGMGQVSLKSLWQEQENKKKSIIVLCVVCGILITMVVCLVYRTECKELTKNVEKKDVELVKNGIYTSFLPDGDLQQQITVYSENGEYYVIRSAEDGKCLAYDEKENVFWYRDDEHSLIHEELENVNQNWIIHWDEENSLILQTVFGDVLSYNEYEEKFELVSK